MAGHSVQSRAGSGWLYDFRLWDKRCLRSGSDGVTVAKVEVVPEGLLVFFRRRTHVSILIEVKFRLVQSSKRFDEIIDILFISYIFFDEIIDILFISYIFQVIVSSIIRGNNVKEEEIGNRGMSISLHLAKRLISPNKTLKGRTETH